MGNNGPVYSAELVRLRTALAGVQHVYLVNVVVPRSWQSEVNDELAQAVRDWPQATLVNWRNTAQVEETYDGIHLRPKGAAAYSELIARSVSP